MRILEDTKLDFSSVLIVPKRSTLSSRKEVDLNRTYTFRNSKLSWTGVPIIASNMDGVGTFAIADKLSESNLLTCIVKHYGIEDWAQQYGRVIRPNFSNIIASCGIAEDEWGKVVRILKFNTDINFLCVDVANGYSQNFLQFISGLRKLLHKYIEREITIIAGNVVTPEMTEELILNGADIVKIGIGPGAVCSTRIQTGIGYPQLSAIIECADAAHGLGGHIIADGGCTSSGDIAKAFGAGADFVMVGGMFAGHDEGGGTIIKEVHNTGRVNLETTDFIVEHKQFVEFYGMSSKTAQAKHGEIKEYRTSEGHTVKIPYKGAVANTISDILGGLRSTCTYVGAKSLKDLSKCTTFIKVNNTHNRVYEGVTVGR